MDIGPALPIGKGRKVEVDVSTEKRPRGAPDTLVLCLFLRGSEAYDLSAHFKSPMLLVIQWQVQSVAIERETTNISRRKLGAEAARGPPPHLSAMGGHGDEEPKTTTRPQVRRARAGELKQEEGQAGPWPHNPAILTIVAVAHDCKAARGRLHDHFASYQI